MPTFFLLFRFTYITVFLFFSFSYKDKSEKKKLKLIIRNPIKIINEMKNYFH